MKEYILSKIFRDAYNEYVCVHGNQLTYIDEKYNTKSLDSLEETLLGFVRSVVGYRMSYSAADLAEIRIYFDNIINNLPLSSARTLEALIKEYQDYYVDVIDSHPYSNALMNVIKRIFSNYYDGKLGNSEHRRYSYGNSETVLRHSRAGHSLNISKVHRKGQDSLPSVRIANIDYTESVLESFIEAVRASNTLYNIFGISGYEYYTENEKIEMIFEGVILNATAYDLANIDLFFSKYTNFINDEKLGALKTPQYIGEPFGEPMYCMFKRSDIEYETPYYMSFMLPNQRLELPCVRVGYDKENNRAHIMAIQTSQLTGSRQEFNNFAKANIPRTKMYNLYNPTHMISLVLALGVLKGMGIDNVEVVDYMPIRYYKTVRDKGMNEQEAHAYIRRVTDQFLNTVLKLETLTEGLKIVKLPGNGYNLEVEIGNEIQCHNELFQKLYEDAYSFGQTLGTQSFGTR